MKFFNFKERIRLRLDHPERTTMWSALRKCPRKRKKSSECSMPHVNDPQLRLGKCSFTFLTLDSKTQQTIIGVTFFRQLCIYISFNLRIDEADFFFSTALIILNKSSSVWQNCFLSPKECEKKHPFHIKIV